MSNKEIKAILICLNSTAGMFKYPIGNRELTEKVKKLENDGKIKFDSMNNKWYSLPNK